MAGLPQAGHNSFHGNLPPWGELHNSDKPQERDCHFTFQVIAASDFCYPKIAHGDLDERIPVIVTLQPDCETTTNAIRLRATLAQRGFDYPAWLDCLRPKLPLYQIARPRAKGWPLEWRNELRRQGHRGGTRKLHYEELADYGSGFRRSPRGAQKMKRFLSAVCWSVGGCLIAGAIPILAIWRHCAVSNDNLANSISALQVATLTLPWAISGLGLGFVLWAGKEFPPQTAVPNCDFRPGYDPTTHQSGSAQEP